MTDDELWEDIEERRQATLARRANRYEVGSFVTAAPIAPPMPMEPESLDGDFNRATASALAATGGFERTSARDRAEADQLRTLGYLAATAITVVGVGVTLLVQHTGVQLVGLLIAAVGIVSMGVQLIAHRQSLLHSEPGVERHRVNTLRAMHRDRLDSRERLAQTALDAWLKHLEQQHRHEERMTRHGR